MYTYTYKKKPHYYTYIKINSECWIDIWIDDMYIDVE